MSNWHPYYSLIRRFRICKNIGGPKYIVHVAACFCLMSPLHFQQEQQQAKRVPDGHGRSFGLWPWQKNIMNLRLCNQDKTKLIRYVLTSCGLSLVYCCFVGTDKHICVCFSTNKMPINQLCQVKDKRIGGQDDNRRGGPEDRNTG